MIITLTNMGVVTASKMAIYVKTNRYVVNIAPPSTFDVQTAVVPDPGEMAKARILAKEPLHPGEEAEAIALEASTR